MAQKLFWSVAIQNCWGLNIPVEYSASFLTATSLSTCTEAEALLRACPQLGFLILALLSVYYQ